MIHPPRILRSAALAGALLALPAVLPAAAAPKITAPRDLVGFDIGDDYHVANYTQISQLLKKWESESDRLKVVSIGLTEEGREQYMAIVTSAANQRRLDEYKRASQALSRAEIPEEEARRLAREAKTVVWIDGGLHATETVNSQSLVELVYQLVSRDDDETRRFLDDVITILPVANPDGVELAANWYMREPDEKKRSFAGLPRLYEKYAGHDNNRDSISMNLKETVNQNRVLYIEWNPQLMLNVHQSGPIGTIVFIPPFRDPFNYNYDPLIPLGIEQAGAALHARLVGKGWGGSVMRSLASYSVWANGGIRYATYFRNQIGLMTEIVGSPTPLTIPLISARQLPTSDGPLPVRPQVWHYRQSIDYEVEIGKGLIDYASRNREQLLYNIYRMGRNSIERGSRDSWTITPKRIAALNAAARERGIDPATGRALATETPADAEPRAEGPGGSIRGLPAELYDQVLHDPAHRDPRGYILSADQDDYATLVKFVNILLKGGVQVHKATAPFSLAGKTYPAGSYVVKAAQAYRPVVLDSFEPLDHPTDLEYPGGPPKRPYDITGWTLAAQTGVAFDRVYEDFDAPLVRLPFEPERPAPAAIAGAAQPAGYLISHRVNDAFILVNRLLKAGSDVYWLVDDPVVDGRKLGAGAIWVPATPQARTVLEQGARELGVPVLARSEKPAGAATKVNPVRVALLDVYGGSMPSGWTRWLFEQYEFPFEVVYPPTLDAGNLRARYDVIVLPSGVYTEARGGRSARGGAPAAGDVDASGRYGPLDPATIPEEFRARLGAVTVAKTIPALKAFVEQGGTLVAVGTSASIGRALGLPIKDQVADVAADGSERRVSNDKFYIPGSVLRAAFNPRQPVAYGFSERGYVFFQHSLTFRPLEGGAGVGQGIAWFDEKEPLYSGWAIGQERLQGGQLVLAAPLGQGRLVLIGFEATFRATPQGTFRLLFNSVHLGASAPVPAL